jgi:alpha-D-ribose 1-methylphosphonate 5-triphosphate synthase subunit PhnG
LQDEGWFSLIQEGLIEPLFQAAQRQAECRARDSNATKVDFFTMVRGEDGA